MADENLLKYSRARDDYQLKERVNAALMKQALYLVEAGSGQSVESVKMMNWVLENPLEPIDLMTAFVAVMPEIVDASVLTEGGIDTSAALDQHIKYQVDVKWNLVATKRFTA